ncbi:DUF2617 family protein [Haloglycomyces albus]|uniref:DUF2617 family protein n=1 Tax=Haloglycomyces albus TaxID=526067 RepID=UPI00046D20AA|nr:DUF2617 family protein [Haloglycomyces albus]
MITALDVPFIDVSAANLTFRPDAPALPVLDSIEAQRGPLALSLRLLGASHQAVVATPEGTLAETLAYRTDLDPDLPSEFGQNAGQWRHEYTCVVETLSLPDLRTRIRGLQARAHRDGTLIGVFGDSPDAITALEVGDTQMEWTTVHTYPQYGEVVTTRSCVRQLH